MKENPKGEDARRMFHGEFCSLQVSRIFDTNGVFSAF